MSYKDLEINCKKAHKNTDRNMDKQTDAKKEKKSKILKNQH